MFTLIAGILGTALAVLGITNYFNNFLNILAAFIPTVAGVVIMDYFVFNKMNPEKWHAVDGFNWAGIISWLGGSAVALAFPSVLVPDHKRNCRFLHTLSDSLPAYRQKEGGVG